MPLPHASTPTLVNSPACAVMLSSTDASNIINVFIMLFIVVSLKSQAGCMCYVVVCINCLPGSLL